MPTTLPWLRIEAPPSGRHRGFVAATAWARDDRLGWVCSEAAPILKWMVGKSAAEVKAYLTGKGWTWQWLPAGE